MIPEFGLYCLILGFMMAVALGIIAPLGLAHQRVAFLQTFSRPAAYGQFLFVLLSFITLTWAFAHDDFSVSYVANNSHATLPWIYKLCAVWGAHEGSLLLWSLILTAWTFLVAHFSKRLPQQAAVMVLGVLGILQLGFLILLLETSNPFLRYLPFSPHEGADLNPLLQDPGFVLHPPFLYMGYVGFAVPFAFAISAMILKNKPFSWSQWARPFALLAWSFLTIGITLGSWWAYYELGWGGWWFWDPVENASFMPWLIGAALVHALTVTSSLRAFHSWSMLLALSAFILSLIGTFLVRSGVVSSVHAFASDPARGTYILGFLSLVMIGSFLLYLRRIKQDVQIKTTLVSRESMLLLGNMIFLVATLTVLLGTLYPIMVDVLNQQKVSVGPPYFNSVFIPIMLPVLVLMAVVPYLQWREDTLAHLWSKIRKMTGCYAVLLIGIVALLYHYSLLTLLGVALGGWVIWSTLWQWRTLAANRWGMGFAHLGVGIAVLGISLTSCLSTEKEMKILPQDVVTINGYQLTFNDIQDIQGPNYEGVRGHFTISKEHKILSELYPEKRYFIPRNLPMTETAISAGLWLDFYLALGERLQDGSWTVRFYIKPFVRWIWLGGVLIGFGALISSWFSFKQLSRSIKNESCQ